MCKAVEEYGDRRAKAAEKEAEARGRKIGEELGKELGKKDAMLTAVRNMKAKGFSVEDISDVTGLSLNEVEQV